MNAIFFDLDGTLLDTARDFAYAINLLLARDNKPLLNFDLFRQQVYGESKKMISFAFDIDETHHAFESIRQDFLNVYHHNCTKNTVFFDGMPTLLDALDANNIRWGIVTSKPTWLTTPIISHFELDKRAVCIVMGDTVDKMKPDPAPLLYACERAVILPSNAIYVGDMKTDIIAAKAAGMKSIGVSYGYHPNKHDLTTWDADFIAHSPHDILSWIQKTGFLK